METRGESSTLAEGVGFADTPPTKRRRSAPIIALLLAAPILSEVLFGTTRITTLFVLLPQIGTWGCAALLIRDLVRRRRRGWHAILLLGLALAVAEECVIQQTSLAPLVGVDPKQAYGRVLGVNWVYFLWALGYEALWAVVLPIQLAELVFPSRRDEPWLSRRGLVISSLVFVLASFVAWYSWTQVFVPRFFPESAYHVPWPPLAIATATIAALAAVALVGRVDVRREAETARSAPRPWVVGLVAFALGLPWFALIFLAYGAAPGVPFAIPIAAGLALAWVAYLWVCRMASRSDWRDAHRLALLSGALGASMLAGFAVLRASAAPPVDFAGKVAFNGLAVLGLAALARRLRPRPTADGIRVL